MKPISDINTPSDMSAFWMPFTANQQFKAAPRILKSAEGMYYHSEDGRKILDGTAGLWCCNAGHGRREIAEAVSTLSVRREVIPSFMTSRSTTISMLCFLFFSSFISSLRS